MTSLDHMYELLLYTHMHIYTYTEERNCWIAGHVAVQFHKIMPHYFSERSIVIQTFFLTSYYQAFKFLIVK